MTDDKLRERVILPVLIPVGAMAFILFIALVMSQILLNVPAEVATAIGMFTALNLLIAFSVMAARPNAGRPLKMFLGAIAVVPLLLGAVGASGMIGFPDEEEDHGAEVPVVEIAADNLQFNKSELEVPADTEFIIHFNNQESQPHNVSIVEELGSTNGLFRGEIIIGPREIDYNVAPIPAGEYHFLCDVHPNMNGTVIAAEGGGGDGEAAAEEH